jgi:hypothetical protein
MLDLNLVGAADFSPVLHDTFKLLIPDGASLDLELVEVSESGRNRPGQERSSFSLLFKGTRDKLLPQQMYRMEHATLGEMDLLIVPVNVDQNGYYYEAVFN